MGDNLLDTLAEHISHSNPIIQYKLQNILYTRSTKCGRNSKEKKKNKERKVLYRMQSPYASLY